MSTLRGVTVAIAVGAGAALAYLLSRTRKKVGMIDSLLPDSTITNLFYSRGGTVNKMAFT
jgi:hypothetical protein